MALSGTCLGLYSPKYCPILPKFSPKVVLKQKKRFVWNIFEGFEFLWKRDGPKLSIFRPTLTAGFALKIAEIEKNKNYCGKTSAVGLLKYIKIKALSPLPFILCDLFLRGNRVRSQLKAVESNFDKNLFYPHNSCQLLVKNFGSSIFQFWGYISQRTFQKKFNPDFQV